jgi:hypothetical protein
MASASVATQWPDQGPKARAAPHQAHKGTASGANAAAWP